MTVEQHDLATMIHEHDRVHSDATARSTAAIRKAARGVVPDSLLDEFDTECFENLWSDSDRWHQEIGRHLDDLLELVEPTAVPGG